MSTSDSIPRRYSPPSLGGVRLRFSSQKPRLCFQYVSTDEWDAFNGRRRIVSQQIIGRSNPVERPTGNEWLIERQPNAIEVFSQQEVSIIIDERARDDSLSNGKHLDIRRSKRLGVQSAFYWGVSDRSFFTRIASAVMQGEVIRFQLHLQDGDEVFTNFLREKQEESYGSVLLPIARITVSV